MTRAAADPGAPRASTGPRIVSLVPSLTELLCTLGLSGQIVGRTGFCIHPRDIVRQIPKVGGTKDDGSLPEPAPAADNGCGCKTAGSSTSTGGWAGIGLLGLGLAVAARRRRASR